MLSNSATLAHGLLKDSNGMMEILTRVIDADPISVYIGIEIEKQISLMHDRGVECRGVGVADGTKGFGLEVC